MGRNPSGFEYLSYNLSVDGTWPSGKALGSGPRIVGSNPTVPAKFKLSPLGRGCRSPNAVFAIAFVQVDAGI